MKFHMFFSFYNHQIFRPVVVMNAIDVMNFFVFSKFTTKNLFRNLSMFRTLIFPAL